MWSLCIAQSPDKVVVVVSYSIVEAIQQPFNSLDLVPTMDTDNYNADEEDEDGALMAVLMVVLHNNMCTMHHIMKKCAHQQQHGISFLPWLTNQDYRHLPRQGNRIFCHNEALVCIRTRDYFGIPRDLSIPIF